MDEGKFQLLSWIFNTFILEDDEDDLSSDSLSNEQNWTWRWRSDAAVPSSWVFVSCSRSQIDIMETNSEYSDHKLWLEGMLSWFELILPASQYWGINSAHVSLKNKYLPILIYWSAQFNLTCCRGSISHKSMLYDLLIVSFSSKHVKPWLVKLLRHLWLMLSCLYSTCDCWPDESDKLETRWEKGDSKCFTKEQKYMKYKTWRRSNCT